VLFYRHTAAASYIRSTLHRYSAFPFVQRTLRLADLMIGVALWNVRQTGLDKNPAVQEKLAQLAAYRVGIDSHLTAAITNAEDSPGGLLMPNQASLYGGRMWALNQLPAMMHMTRELCGGQICITPDAAAFADPEAGVWLRKYYTLNDEWTADDRRKLLAFGRDLLNSDYAGHRLTFQLFAQSPPFAQSAALYRSFDFENPLNLVKDAAGLSDGVSAEAQ
jgi:4-hydroxyphenylacetate 3-monooxygenase